MGMDFIGREGFSLNRSAWNHVLTVAWTFGWRPEGTLPPPPDFWQGEEWDKEDYFSNSWQVVTDTDAKAMAAALELALTACEANEQLSGAQSRFLEWAIPGLISAMAGYAKGGGFAIG